MYVSPGCSMPSAPRDTSFSNVRDIPRGQPSARVLPRAQRMVLGMVPRGPRAAAAARVASPQGWWHARRVGDVANDDGEIVAVRQHV